MYIKYVAIGNKEEAFYTDSLTSGFNIISSDDNNKGKTIVIQSCLYAMGNNPAFPSSFDFKNHYHIVSFIDDGKEITSCRKGDSFIVNYEKKLFLFESVSEYKRFLNKIGLVMPVIYKDGLKKMVDPCLLFELFFVGQDKKNTSTVVNNGQYNKDDFLNMIYSFCGLYGEPNDLDRVNTKKRITELEQEKASIKRINKIFNKKNSKTQFISSYVDNEKIKEKIKVADEIREKIVELSNKRNRLINKRLKNQQTIDEINSLNLSIKTGELVCKNCHSNNIVYESSDRSYSFDITSKDLRNKIILSINEKIEIYNEQIEETSYQINLKQKELQSILKDNDFTFEDLLVVGEKMKESFDADSRLLEIDKEIEQLKNKLVLSVANDSLLKEQKESLLRRIKEEMNTFYKDLDPSGTNVFDLFSKSQSIYSGVEATEFYLSRLYALQKVTNHNYPIIMDYFRDGELSTQKENKVLAKFKELDNQIIFTATLKSEEDGKYQTIPGINNISFSEYTPNKLLNRKYVGKLSEILSSFNIELK